MGSKILKNLALVAGSVVALGAIRKKAKQQQADQQLWNQATDPVPPTTSAGSNPSAS